MHDSKQKYNFLMEIGLDYNLVNLPMNIQNEISNHETLFKSSNYTDIFINIIFYKTRTLNKNLYPKYYSI